VASGTAGTVEVLDGVIEPSISDASAGQTAVQLNQTLDTGLALVSQGEKVYTFTAPELVRFIHVDATLSAGVFRVDADREALTSVLGEAIVTISAKPGPKFTLVDGSGQELTVLREGRPARTLADMPSAIESIAKALAAGESSVETQWNTVDAGSQTITVGGAHEGHWVDVHLDSQTATMFDGTTPIKTFLISGGLPDTPTPQGSFQIWVKELDTSIVGPDYSYYGIVWVGWNNTYALHSAYWHDAFGEPMSHGCINMRKDDVLEVYDWLDYGQWVEVHP
jgi:hypothetical protein